MQYGLDAARLPLWFATACQANARAARGELVAERAELGRPLGSARLSLSGATINPDVSPLTLLAGAAAATAAGDDRAARELRVRAATVARRFPTYYGEAWAALGPACLTARSVPARRAKSTSSG